MQGRSMSAPQPWSPKKPKACLNPNGSLKIRETLDRDHTEIKAGRKEKKKSDTEACPEEARNGAIAKGNLPKTLVQNHIRTRAIAERKSEGIINSG